MDKSPDPLAGEIHLSGTASDHGGVYQAGRDQTVTHFSVHVGTAPGPIGSAQIDRRVTTQAAQQHAQRVIEALALAVEHFRKRCVELAEEARRARAEGRREALREVQEKLRDAELRVIRAQEKKREAERERERLEALVARTRYEAEAERRQPTPLWGQPDDERTFEDVLASADDELRLIRAELRTLASDFGRGEAPSGGNGVVSGEVVPEPRPSQNLADTGPETALPVGSPKSSTGGSGSQAARTGSQRLAPTVRLGLVRRYLGRVFFGAAGLPMPMAGAAIRAVYSREPGVAVVWSVLFPVAAGILAVAAVSLLILFARLAYAWPKDDGSIALSCFFHAALGVALLAVGIFLSPATAPLLTDCGRLIAEYVGPL
ncbi:hypothetical protein [Streptomyces bobili]|uniref:hypothetical protein n=1 Tax=Streptomyces bobili TaxID=67280 RepID=UPI000A3868D5|nr:hypothetical protein [Streptomyces bobili]